VRRAPLVLGALLALCVPASAATPADWTTYGNGTARAGDAAAAPQTLSRDFVLPLAGRIVGQVLSAGGRFYAATTAGEVAAFTADGSLLWHEDVGQLALTCQQLDGYGIVGTGVIDEGSNTLYVADGFGRLHALDLATGAEHDGWPVRVLADFRRELVWGALTLADGAVYVPTASYCDSPSMGGVYRVDLATQAVSTWFSVPSSEGGGGGVWGWGGTAYSAGDDALYAVTANAFAGGSNMDDDFSESAGYGEHLVKLGPDLSVEDSDHPSDLTTPADLDFVGSPVVFDRTGCGELVVGADKDDVLYAWPADNVGAGPLWELPLQDFDSADPLLSQLAWSPELASLYAVTGTQLLRISVGADCSPKVDWRQPLGTKTENGSPTIAGDTVWFAANDPNVLDGYDARTGARVFQAPLGGTTVAAPTIVDDRLVVGTMSGLVEGFTFDAPASHLPTWKTALHVTKRIGIASIDDHPGRCMCATRQYYTNDAGKSWHETTTVSDEFTASGGRVYFWTANRLSMLASLKRTTTSARLSSVTVATVPDGTITQVDPIPGGVAALVSSRVHGQGWDTGPRVLLVQGSVEQTLTLPTARGRLLVQSIDADWPKLTVTATDFVAHPARAAVWVSPDGGATWSLG